MVMPPGAGRHVPASTSRARRSTTCDSGRWPATRAGACPRRASCASARMASHSPATPPSSGRSRPRPRRTPSSACRSSSPSCARTHGEFEAALAGTLPSLITLGDLRGDLHSHSEWSDGAPPDRGHGRGRPPSRLRLPGPHRPHPVAGHRPRARARPGRAAARDHRGAQRAVRGRGGRRHGPARDAARGLPPPARLRARDPGRRRARLRRRPARAVRPGRRVRPRRPTPVAGRADRAGPSTGSAARTSTSSPTRPAARSASATTSTSTGTRLRRGCPDRDGARDERLAAAPGPGGRARAAGRRDRLPAVDRLRRAPHRRARLRELGHQPGAAGLGRAGDVLNTRSRADLLAWVAAKPERV